MTKRHFILFAAFIVSSAALVAVLFSVRNDKVPAGGQVAGVATNEPSLAVLENTSQDLGNVSSDQSPLSPQPSPGDTLEDNNSPAQAVPPAENNVADPFRIVYLARFTGTANSPTVNTFSRDDHIILVVRLRDGLKTDALMTTNIYKADKMVKSYPPLEILNGEIGLENPGKAGAYTVRVAVGEKTLYELPFRVE